MSVRHLAVLTLLAPSVGRGQPAPDPAAPAVPHASIVATVDVEPLAQPMPVAATAPRASGTAGDTTRPGRPRAVEVGASYETRLRIHRWGSYVMLPLFATQYVLGSRLLDQKEGIWNGTRTEPLDGGLRDAHRYTAYGVGALFAANTVTGVWNWIDSRHVADGRARRTIHALSMLAADAGFVATGIAGARATDGDVGAARRHRNVALASVGVSTLSAAAMLFLDRD